MFKPFKKDQMQDTCGFSLVELAVVLAIIGLLAGGVLATSSYLKTAQQTTVINEGKYYLNALKQFQAKYDGALPGDMGNASSYWSGAVSGNGNGTIESTGTIEIFLAFKHLQLSGLAAGQYSGTNGPAGPLDSVIGLNVPALSMEGVTAWYLTPNAAGHISADADYFDGYYGTVLHIAKPSTGQLPRSGFLSPREAYELDQKFDDGQPDKGWIRTMKSYTDCVGGTTSYLATPTANACLLILSAV